MTTLDHGESTEQLPSAPAPQQAWVDDEDHPRRPVRQRLGPMSLVLCGALVAAAGFLGGVLTQKHEGRSTVSTTTAAGAAAGRTGTGRAGTGGGTTTGAAGTGTAPGVAGAATGTGGAGGAVTVGSVTLVDGNNIYVTTQNGAVVKVATGQQSTVMVTKVGSAKDVKPGDTVQFAGATGADGTVAATSVRDFGAGALAGGGRGNGARNGGGVPGG